MEKNSKILITGSTGLIGNALLKILKNKGYQNLVAFSSKDCDLRDQFQVRKKFAEVNPDYVFHLAAVVGGIKANSSLPAKFIYDNTLMQSNVIHYCYEFGVKKLLFVGSACTYPKIENCQIDESLLFKGMPEVTNIAYATAKLNGIIMCESYQKQYGLNVAIVMPTNTYGVNDHYNLENSHVIPALIMKFHEAVKTNAEYVTLWGSGKPMREFIFADDVADSFEFIMNNYNSSDIINVGTMEEISILELANLIKEITGFKGKIIFDQNYPDGIMRKCLNSQKLFDLGWKPKTKLIDGIKLVYNNYINCNLVDYQAQV